MDKIKIIILAFTLALVSCNKEQPIQQEDEKSCYCGTPTLIDRTWNSSGQVINYNYTIFNNCTNAPIKVETRQEIKGNQYCLEYQW